MSWSGSSSRRPRCAPFLAVHGASCSHLREAKIFSRSSNTRTSARVGASAGGSSAAVLRAAYLCPCPRLPIPAPSPPCAVISHSACRASWPLFARFSPGGARFHGVQRHNRRVRRPAVQHRDRRRARRASGRNGRRPGARRERAHNDRRPDRASNAGGGNGRKHSLSLLTPGSGGRQIVPRRSNPGSPCRGAGWQWILDHPAVLGLIQPSAR